METTTKIDITWIKAQAVHSFGVPDEQKIGNKRDQAHFDYIGTRLFGGDLAEFAAKIKEHDWGFSLTPFTSDGMYGIRVLVMKNTSK